MERRKFLAVTAASGAAGLAGCSSVLGSDPANLKSPTINAPEEVAYGDDATLAVSVENTGEKKGTFSATLRSPSAAIDFEQAIELTVPGGETAEAETDPISFPGAGEYKFELEDQPASSTETSEGEAPAAETLATTTLTVTTVVKEPSETVTVSDTLNFTVDSVEFASTVFTGGESPRGVFIAPSGKVLAVYHVSLENVGTQSATWNPSLVNVEGGEFYGQNAPSISNAGEALGVAREVSPSEIVTGYMVAQFPTDAVRTKAPLTVQADEANTQPEYKWEFAASSERTFADIALQSVDAPSSTAGGEPYDITLTFTNNGDGAGAVKGVLQYQEFDDWTKLGTADQPVIEKEIGADETVEVTVSNTASTWWSDTFSYRVAPFVDQTWETTFE